MRHVEGCVNSFQSCVHSVGSDAMQGFHQSLYSCLRALQEEEWELFQYTLDNAKYVIILNKVSSIYSCLSI